MRFGDLPRAIDRCGPLGALKLFTARRKLRHVLPDVATISHRGLPFPLHFRRVSTDRYVIAEVLLRDQYACLTGRAGVRTIVDVGANIGTTSLYLLGQYPDARLIALEPDPANFDVLLRNLEPYGGRATAIQAALWPRSEALFVDRGRFRDGGDWSVQVTDMPVAGAPVVRGITLSDVFDEFAIEVAHIVKIDVEGAERRLFADGLGGTINRIGVLAIELHDQECRRLFGEMIDGRSGKLSQDGEVTVWDQAEGSTSPRLADCRHR